MKKISLPLKKKDIAALKTGDKVLLSGIIYTARDQAHKRLVQNLLKKKKLPFPVKGSVIYYCGPAPALPGRTIGSCGPTTASRMDDSTPLLLMRGLKAMIGKGRRSQEVKKAIKKCKCIYFLAVGGTGALLAGKVKKANVLAYKDLGPEAIYKLEVIDFPAMVAIDVRGNDIFLRR